MSLEIYSPFSRGTHASASTPCALMAGLQRIASHLLAVGTYGLDIGSITPFLWCFRDREKILDLFEWVSGARLLYNYLWIGGAAYDLPADYLDQVREFVDYFTPRVHEVNALLSMNKICIERTAHIGIMPPEVAISHGRVTQRVALY